MEIAEGKLVLAAFCKTEQIFAHVENKSAHNGERHDVQARGFWQPPRRQAPYTSSAESGVHAGAPAELPSKKAIEKVARNQPAAYLKILALLVPREMKVEHSGGVKAMSDEQLEAGIEAIQAMLERRAVEGATLIEGIEEPAALLAPEEQSIEAAPEATHRRKLTG